MTQARRVRLVLRRIEPWSVLKFSLLLFASLYLVLLVAAFSLWSAASVTGLRGNVESFVGDLVASEDFHFQGGELARASLLGGTLLVLVASGVTVLLSVLHNLISDLMGGFGLVFEERPTRRKDSRRSAAESRPRRSVWADDIEPEPEPEPQSHSQPRSLPCSRPWPPPRPPRIPQSPKPAKSPPPVSEPGPPSFQPTAPPERGPPERAQSDADPRSHLPGSRRSPAARRASRRLSPTRRPSHHRCRPRPRPRPRPPRCRRRGTPPPPSPPSRRRRPRSAGPPARDAPPAQSVATPNSERTGALPTGPGADRPLRPAAGGRQPPGAAAQPACSGPSFPRPRGPPFGPSQTEQAGPPDPGPRLPPPTTSPAPAPQGPASPSAPPGPAPAPTQPAPPPPGSGACPSAFLLRAPHRLTGVGRLPFGTNRLTPGGAAHFGHLVGTGPSAHRIGGPVSAPLTAARRHPATGGVATVVPRTTDRLLPSPPPRPAGARLADPIPTPRLAAGFGPATARRARCRRRLLSLPRPTGWLLLPTGGPQPVAPSPDGTAAQDERDSNDARPSHSDGTPGGGQAPPIEAGSPPIPSATP